MAQLVVRSLAGDGNVYIDNGGTWATVRGATSGTAQPLLDLVNVYASSFTSRSIGRIFIPFDTSALTAAATITSASLQFNVDTVSGSAGTIHLVQTTQASTSTLDNADFNNVNFTSGGSVAVSTTGAKTINLNATALTWISKTGSTLLGLLEEHDQADSDPGASSDFRFVVNMSETPIQANEPTLTITYTLPSTGAKVFTFL